MDMCQKENQKERGVLESSKVALVRFAAVNNEPVKPNALDDLVLPEVSA
jgi:hypothetical protein